MRLPEDFQRRVEEAAGLLMEYSGEGSPALLVSHYDADGLTSAAILVSVMQQLEIPCHVRIIDQLDRESAADIARHRGYPLIIFSDLGSGQKDLLSGGAFQERALLIIDHHEPSSAKPSARRFVELNPRPFGIDGSVEISAAGLAYLVARTIDARNVELAPLALVGALGDLQDRGERGRLLGVNLEIAKEAAAAGYVAERLSLRIPGLYSRGLAECLARSFNPYIPGLTGNEISCVKFLREIGIDPGEDRPRKFTDLSEEEVRRLVTALIKYMIDVGVPAREAERIVGYVYLFPKNPAGTPLYEGREFSMLVNACGRLGLFGLAIALCLGDPGALEEAQRVAEDYRARLSRLLKLVASREIVEEFDELYCIHGDLAEAEPRIIGAVASIACNGLLPKPKPVVAFAAADGGSQLKVSARLPPELSGRLDLGALIKKAASAVGGTGGGHEVAAGALVPASRKREFIEILRAEVARHR